MTFKLKVFFFSCLIYSLSLQAEKIQMDIHAEAAILMNADNGRILYAKNINSPLYPASTTKIAAVLYTLKTKKEDLDTVLTASTESLASITGEEKRKANYKHPAYWLEPDGSSIGLKKGEEMSLRDLLYGMLLASGNDASNVVAQHVGNDIPTFVERMNQYLKEIGCTQTHFLNPHGLHHPKHQTTAYDLAVMTREALKEPLFKKIVSTPRYTRPKTNLQKASTWLNSNKLLRTGKFYYSKAFGVKTGSHSHAKKTFVGAAELNGRTLIAVLLKSPDRATSLQETTKLFEAAFNQSKIQHNLLTAGPQLFKRQFLRTNVPLSTYTVNDIVVSYYPAEDPEPRCLLYWKELSLPIHKGDQVGELKIIASDDQVLNVTPLYAENDVQYNWPISWIANMSGFIDHHPFLASLLFILSLAIFVGSVLNLSRR